MSTHLQSGQHPDADQISAFVDHALPAHEREVMLAHLAECADCREIVTLSLPAIESAPPAVKQTRSWWWDFRLMLPVAAAGFAVLLLYVHHATNSKREDVQRGPEIALQKPATPTENQPAAPPSGAAASAGSTSLSSRVLKAPTRVPSTQAPAPTEQPAVAEANGLALDKAAAVIALHLPDGTIPISTVTRGRQVLAIDDRNALFLSNDGGKSWQAVQVPWKGRAVHAELTSYSMPAVSGGTQSAAQSGVPSKKATDADAFRAQKELRQELKGSYKAAENEISDARPAPPSQVSAAPALGGAPSLHGTLSGVVTDRTGAVVPGASVALTKPDGQTSAIAVTDAEGKYHIDGLAPGSYQLEAKAPGFNATKISGIQLGAVPALARNVVLDVGASSQTVTVQANAPQMDSSLPELGRNAITLKQKPVSPNALTLAAPVFEVTTDSGDHWISSDGLNWQPR